MLISGIGKSRVNFAGKWIESNSANQIDHFMQYLETNKNKYYVLLYHGTSDETLQLIQQTGVINAPTERQAEDREARSGGLDLVFLTANFEYASEYAIRAADHDNAAFSSVGKNPIVLQIMVPIIDIQDFKIQIQQQSRDHLTMMTDEELAYYTELPTPTSEEVSYYSQLFDYLRQGHFEQAADVATKACSILHEATTKTALPAQNIKQVIPIEMPSNQGPQSEIEDYINRIEAGESTQEVVSSAPEQLKKEIMQYLRDNAEPDPFDDLSEDYF